MNFIPNQDFPKKKIVVIPSQSKNFITFFNRDIPKAQL